MGAQGVHLGGSLLVKGAEERKEEAVLVEPSRPSACVDHALLQPSPHVGVLGLEIAEDQLVDLLPLVVVVSRGNTTARSVLQLHSIRC